MDVGSEGSNVDMDAYNVMLYYSIPKTETKYLDTIIGVGRLRTDITTAYDGKIQQVIGLEHNYMEQ